MAYNVLEVSQHIINYSIENERPVTNLKLQKILYYIQAAFLVEFGEPCFDEEIEHWRHGPVIPKVYSKYKSYMDRRIRDRQENDIDIYIGENASLVIKRIDYNEVDFFEDDLELMNEVIDSYSNTDPWEMVDKTHGEQPWIGTNPNEIITKESIKEFFKRNREEIYGG